MRDVLSFGFPGTTSAMRRHLVPTSASPSVPGSAFYKRSSRRSDKLRFTFCKKDSMDGRNRDVLVKLAASGP